MKKKKNQSGQSITEYILVMLVIVGLISFVMKWMKTNEFFFKNVTQPMVSYLRFNYKYGDQNALGFDEQNPRRHILMTPSGGNIKIFVPSN
jgi:hypothetical protein